MACTRPSLAVLRRYVRIVSAQGQDHDAFPTLNLAEYRVCIFGMFNVATDDTGR